MSWNSDEADEAWVTVATPAFLGEALVIQGRFQAEGIDALIPGQHLATIHPGMTGLQIRVQVRASRVTQAHRVLRELEQEQDSDEDEEPNP